MDKEIKTVCSRCRGSGIIFATNTDPKEGQYEYVFLDTCVYGLSKKYKYPVFKYDGKFKILEERIRYVHPEQGDQGANGDGDGKNTEETHGQVTKGGTVQPPPNLGDGQQAFSYAPREASGQREAREERSKNEIQIDYDVDHYSGEF